MDLKKIFYIIILSTLVLGLAGTGKSIAQGTPPNIRVSIALTDSNANDPKLVYSLNDPIPIVFTMNNEGDAVITSKGFSNRPFHLFLNFIGPDGKVIRANELATSVYNDPGPPPLIFVNGEPLQAEPVEVIESAWVWSTAIPNAHSYYSLLKIGRYSVNAIIPIRTYSSISHVLEGIEYSLIDSFAWAGTLISNTAEVVIVADYDGDGYFYPEAYGQYAVADCDDNNPAVNPGALEITGNGRDDDCNLNTPDGNLVELGTIIVRATKTYQVSGKEGGPRKEPLEGLHVRAYENSSGSCAASYKNYQKNFKAIWEKCLPQEAGKTDSTGTVRLNVIPGNYIVLGMYDPNTQLPGDELFLGVSVGKIAAGKTLEKTMNLTIRPDGKMVAE